LSLLTEVQQQPAATPRQLSVKLGIALGITNLLLQNLVEKGYISISNAGWSKFIYALTPDGVSRKINLTLGYVHRFLEHYSNVRQTLRDELAHESLNAEYCIAIYGNGEFAELVYLGLKELGIEEIEIFLSDVERGGKFLGMPIQHITDLRPDQYDRVVIATLGHAENQYQKLLNHGIGQGKLIRFFTPKDSQSDDIAKQITWPNGRKKTPE